MTDASPPVPAALGGVLVADFSRVLAGPLATMTLGDLGADVVKVEALAGDETRGWSPPAAGDGSATYFLAVNRNKRSIALDLTDAGDRRLALELAGRADVMVDNFKPGGLARLGLDPDALREANPRLVHCSITGFGAGAGASLPGYDPLVQALSGLMSITGPAGGEPAKVGVALVDVIAGLGAAVAILAALAARERTGAGQRIEVDLLSSALAALVNQASGYLNAAAIPARLGNVHPSIEPFATYEAADGPLMICAGNDRQFAALAGALGAPELAADPRFETNPSRVANRAELRRLIEARLGGETVAEWAERLREAGVPAGPVNDVAGAFELAEALGLAPVDELDGVRTVSSPLGLRATPPATRRRPPRLDEHGAEIRAWLAGG
ncbi:MAG: CoA transferase [Solirubrobacterales bacterium]|nr:CoA transferase [Solirubrobacterales bacterium]